MKVVNMEDKELKQQIAKSPKQPISPVYKVVIAVLVIVAVSVLYLFSFALVMAKETALPETITVCAPSPEGEVHNAVVPTQDVSVASGPDSELEHGCPIEIIPETITMRNNYDFTVKTKFADRTHILPNTMSLPCYKGVRSWQDPKYLYCENVWYDGDEGRYLVTFALNTKKDYDSNKDLIEYEVEEMGCVQR